MQFSKQLELDEWRAVAGIVRYPIGPRPSRDNEALSSLVGLDALLQLKDQVEVLQLVEKRVRVSHRCTQGSLLKNTSDSSEEFRQTFLPFGQLSFYP